MGLPPLTYRFVYNLVSARHVTCRFGELEETRWIYQGLPQSSVLSSLLCTIYVSQIENACTLGRKILQYADDVSIYTRLLCFGDNVRTLEESISYVAKNLYELGLSLSTGKTQYCIFSKDDRELNSNR